MTTGPVTDIVTDRSPRMVDLAVDVEVQVHRATATMMKLTWHFQGVILTMFPTFKLSRSKRLTGNLHPLFVEIKC